MAREQGARTALAVAFETVYGTAPVGGYVQVPFASVSLGEDRALLESELLGQGRDPLAPVLDVITLDGDVVIPLDAANLGIWLKGAFGAPVTTGATADKTHTFQSGSFTLPSMSIEKAMPNVPLFEMFRGCTVNTLRWTMQRGGQLTGTVSLIGQKAARATATAAGTPTVHPLHRFGHAQGAVARDGATLGNVVSAEIAYTNNLDPISVIRSDGAIEAVDPTIAGLSGSLTVRFDSTALLDQAVAGEDCELVFSHEISGTRSFTFTAHAVHLSQPRLPIEGPGGIQATFNFQGAKGDSPARMCTAVLLNQIASYT